MSNLQTVITELSKCFTMVQWIRTRQKFAKTLTLQEMAQIDSSGLITKTLGHDESYFDFQLRKSEWEAKQAA